MFEMGVGLVTGLVSSFFPGPHGWAVDVNEGQIEQIVHFKLFVRVQHFTQIFQQDIGTRTVHPPFACG